MYDSIRYHSLRGRTVATLVYVGLADIQEMDAVGRQWINAGLFSRIAIDGHSLVTSSTYMYHSHRHTAPTRRARYYPRESIQLPLFSHPTRPLLPSTSSSLVSSFIHQ